METAPNDCFICWTATFWFTCSARNNNGRYRGLNDIASKLGLVWSAISSQCFRVLEFVVFLTSPTARVMSYPLIRTQQLHLASLILGPGKLFLWGRLMVEGGCRDGQYLQTPPLSCPGLAPLSSHSALRRMPAEKVTVPWVAAADWRAETVTE